RPGHRRARSATLCRMPSLRSPAPKPHASPAHSQLRAGRMPKEAPCQSKQPCLRGSVGSGRAKDPSRRGGSSHRSRSTIPRGEARRLRPLSRALTALASVGFAVLACGGSNVTGTDGDMPAPLPEAACDVDGGGTEVAEPTLTMEFSDSWQEAWLGSPAVVDLDDDGEMEIIAPRGATLKVW